MTAGSRSLLAPEVVQTSAMDCGPASLKSLLEGYGISASYGRLREACQTDVDGSSIDTMEEIAGQLGLDAEQVMVPTDHLLLKESRSLPAIVVVRQPNGFTHFVVLWRTHGRFVQVMDPATGRAWWRSSKLIEDLYIHSMPVPAEAWRQYAGGSEFLDALRALMHDIGITRGEGERLIEQGMADPGWRSLAALDAAVRMVGSIARSGGLSRGRHGAGLLRSFFQRALGEGPEASEAIPSDYWSVRPAPPDGENEPQLRLRGAVLVRVRGRHTADTATETDEGPAPLSPELLRALEEPPSRPGRQLLDLLRSNGPLAPLMVVTALLVAASGVVVEALLFRGLFDLGFDLALPEQRLGVILAFAAIAFALLLLELPVSISLLRFGRRLEVRLRLAFMAKIPRLGDRYFQSRPISDMAERSHSIYGLRLLPEFGGQLLRSIAQFLLTIAGIIWLDPAAAPVAIVGGALVLALPFTFLPLLSERDLKARTHVGALGRFYLDALVGLVPVRTHGAERSVRREHESLLVEWARASLRLQRTATVVEGIQSLTGMGLAAWLLFDHLSRTGGSSGVLLLVYWALQLPMLGQTIGMLARQYPGLRNLTLRLMEPLGAKDEGRPDATDPGESDRVEGDPAGGRSSFSSSRAEAVPGVSERIKDEEGGAVGVAISMNGVSVVAAGQTILAEVSLEIGSGEHVAIVGHSGAGKSSFAGLLLGWHRAASGDMRIDGVPLDELKLATLRRQTAWVDPAVQIWNRSFIENLTYGNEDHPTPPGGAIELADLRSVLERLPDGLRTPVGESGGLVSGGEGQRLRLGRSLLRTDVRLVIFDEPFRGLDRDRRRILLKRAREIWSDVTMLCITHDVAETLAFERVLVLDAGRIVEDDRPSILAERDGSHYRILLDADRAVREGAWSGRHWRQLRIDRGSLVECEPREESI